MMSELERSAAETAIEFDRIIKEAEKKRALAVMNQQMVLAAYYSECIERMKAQSEFLRKIILPRRPPI